MGKEIRETCGDIMSRLVSEEGTKLALKTVWFRWLHGLKRDIDHYNSIGYGDARVVETESHVVVVLYNAGFSENEELDKEWDTRYARWRIVCKHPMRVFEFDKRVRWYNKRVNGKWKVNFIQLESKDWSMLSQTEHYHKRRKFIFKIEVE
jgi:hypothetical protein